MSGGSAMVLMEDAVAAWHLRGYPRAPGKSVASPKGTSKEDALKPVSPNEGHVMEYEG